MPLAPPSCSRGVFLNHYAVDAGGGAAVALGFAAPFLPRDLVVVDVYKKSLVRKML